MPGFKKHSKAVIKTFFLVLIPIFAWLWYINDKSFVFIYKQWWMFPICFFLTYLGALFPDIDIASKSRNVIYSVVLIFDIILIKTGYLDWAAWLGFFAILFSLSKHRGFMHSLTAAILLPLPLLVIPIIISGKLRDIGIIYYISALFGILSHLVLDKKWRF